MGSDLRRWEAADREALEFALARIEAERDELKRRIESTPPWPDDGQALDGEQMRALMLRWSTGPELYQADADALIATARAAIAERDRLRRELEALRGALRERASLFDGDARRSGAELAYEARTVADRIAAILAGPEKEPTDAA